MTDRIKKIVVTEAIFTFAIVLVAVCASNGSIEIMRATAALLIAVRGIVSCGRATVNTIGQLVKKMTPAHAYVNAR